MSDSPQAWVTLATNDQYAVGALVLAQSLRRVNTSRQLAVMITPDVTEELRSVLSNVFDYVHTVNVWDSNDPSSLAKLGRPELGITLTKLHCWMLTRYSKCVFMDADCLAIQNCDELFDCDEFSAAPDVGWPDCFNSGVFVYTPSEATFKNLVAFAQQFGTYDGGDQGLLNQYFSDWRTSDAKKHLSFIYNMTVNPFYSYLPAFSKFGNNIKVIHFIGQMKPWHYQYNAATHTVNAAQDSGHYLPFVQLWWDIFTQQTAPLLENVKTGLAKRMRQMTITPPPGAEEGGPLFVDRREAWERGHIDYLGEDSFEKIQQKLDEAIADAAKGPGGTAGAAEAGAGAVTASATGGAAEGKKE